MKRTKRFLAVVLCMLLMLTPLAVVAETVTVQAAADAIIPRLPDGLTTMW